MLRKLTLIFVLAILFGAFLIVSPYLKEKIEPPTIEDRLPDADFMATLDCIRFAKEVSGMMYYYKVPYRDFLSPEFILSQGKAYGLQLQNPSYFFANKSGEYGILVELTDSTKLGQGVEKLKHFFDVKEFKIKGQKVYKINDFQSYLFYENDYICFYKGDSIRKYTEYITSAKHNQISPTWIELINQKKYLNKSVVIYSKLDDFKQVSVNQVFAYPVIDSTHVYFYASLSSKDTLPISLKNSGMDFKTGEFSKLAINLHLDPTYLQNNTNHPLYSYLLKQSARISFPMKDFIEQWDGDLSFQQGGWVMVDEKYIESELDDDFNVTEVVKHRQVKVSGFSVNYSLKNRTTKLLEVLKKKGFLTEQEKKYHLLLSPPLNFVQNQDNTQTFYTSHAAPKMIESQKSYIMWAKKGTNYTVYIDSIKTFDLYGKLVFSMEQLLSPKSLEENF